MNPQYIQHQLVNWYERNQRALPWRETDDPYRIWISEIILQQTRVVQGYDYYLRFIEHFPTVRHLAAASEDEVLLLWQGLGYYSRARNLHQAAQQVLQQYEGVFPRDYASVRALKGIGDYTAAAICSFAYNQAYAVLDGNVYRVLARLYDDATPIDSTAGKKRFMQLADTLLSRANPRLHNQAIMELGALQCTPQNPNCAQCPLHSACLACAHQTVQFLPVKSKQTSVKDRYFNYVINICNHRTVIQQRQHKDIWQHLYEFPLYESDHLLSANELMQQLQSGRVVRQSPDLVHLLSHQRIHARFFLVETDALQPDDGQIIIAEESLADYALSRLTQKGIASLL